MSKQTTRSKYLALAKETVRGTQEVSSLVYMPITTDSELDYALNHIPDDLSRGVAVDFAPAAGRLVGQGKIKGNVESTTIGHLLNSLFGTVTSTEQAVVTISSTNKYLDFNIGAAELVATVAEGSYKIGLTQADTGTLCKAIYDAIHAAEAVGTYTVTYSRSTKKFTVTRSTGTFQIMWKTGTHGADGTDTHIGTTLGFSDAANSTGALTYTGATAVEYCFKHTFTRGIGVQNPAYTMHLVRALTGLTSTPAERAYITSVCKALKLEIPVDAKVMFDADFLFKKEEASTAVLSPSWSTPAPFVFNQATVSINSVANTTEVGAFSLNIDNGSSSMNLLDGNQYANDILTQGKMLISGNFGLVFESLTQREAFLANTAVDLSIRLRGAQISGSFYHQLDIAMPGCHYNAFPFGDQGGLLAANAAFNAFYKPASGYAISVDLYNQDASY